MQDAVSHHSCKEMSMERPTEPEDEKGGGDAAGVGHCRVSVDGEVLYADDRMARLLGLARGQELVGRSTTEFYRDLTEREELIRELLSREAVSDATVEVRTANGRLVSLRQSCRLEEDPESGRTVIEKRVRPAGSGSGR